MFMKKKKKKKPKPPTAMEILKECERDELRNENNQKRTFHPELDLNNPDEYELYIAFLLEEAKLRSRLQLYR